MEDVVFVDELRPVDEHPVAANRATATTAGTNRNTRVFMICLQFDDYCLCGMRT
jgi:hypothetical protein